MMSAGDERLPTKKHDLLDQVKKRGRDSHMPDCRVKHDNNKTTNINNAYQEHRAWLFARDFLD
jgi:hypothetical protein